MGVFHRTVWRVRDQLLDVANQSIEPRNISVNHQFFTIGVEFEAEKEIGFRAHSDLMMPNVEVTGAARLYRAASGGP